MEKSQTVKIRTKFNLDELPYKNIHFKTNIPILIQSKDSLLENSINKNLHFEDCIFESDLELYIGLKISSNMKFINCVFKKNAVFKKTQFIGRVDFINNEFKGDVLFENSRFKKVVDFDKSSFKKNVLFQKAVFEKNINLNKEQFEGNISFENSTFKETVNFERFIFKKQASFQGAVFEKNVNFSKVQFEGEVNFFQCKFGNKLEKQDNFDKETLFYKSNFKQSVNFKRSQFNHNVSFQDAIFEKSLSLDNSKFKGKARFYEAKFKGDTNFHNTAFEDLADFWNTKFCRKLIFYKTDFLGTTVLSRAVFKENVLFTYSRITNLLILRGAKFKKGLDFSVAIIEGHLALFDIKIEDYQCVEVSKVLDEKINTENISKEEKIERKYEYLITQLAEIPKKNKRETFRILKSSLLQQGNSIDYLKYARLEQKTYKAQLLENKALFDFIILGLNELSNNHGRSYWRGILFTFGFGVLIFYLSILATDNYSFSYQGIILEESIIKYFFEFMNPVHNSNYLKNEDPTSWNYVLDFFGRIIVSYGFYQTVQAFRKFKK